MFTDLADRARLLAAQLGEGGWHVLGSHAAGLGETLAAATPAGPHPAGVTLDPALSLLPRPGLPPAAGTPVVVWDDPLDPEQIEWPLLVANGRLLLAEYPGHKEPRPGHHWSREGTDLRVRLASLRLFATQTIVLTDLVAWLTDGPVGARRADGRLQAGDRARPVLDAYTAAYDDYIALTLGVVEDHARRLLEDSTTTPAAVVPLRLRKD